MALRRLPLRGRLRGVTERDVSEARGFAPPGFSMRRGGDRASLGARQERRSDNVYLSRHSAAGGPRWALDGSYLPEGFTLTRLLEGPAAEARAEIGRASCRERV